MEALAGVAAPGYPSVGHKRSLIESLLIGADHGPGGSNFLPDDIAWLTYPNCRFIASL